MPQTPRDIAIAISLRKNILSIPHQKRDQRESHIIQEIINQNDLATQERKRKMKNQWQRQNSKFVERSFRGKHDDGQGSYRNKNGEYIGSTNRILGGKEYLVPIKSRKGTEWHFKQLGKIE
tara:strand:- start:1001 stop:1363 length:363 start_codon:yes stop_codon:yes gene_type:complete